MNLAPSVITSAPAWRRIVAHPAFARPVTAALAMLLLFVTVELRKLNLDLRPPLSVEANEPYIVPVGVARYATLGFDRLLTDFYWLVMVNYMGTLENLEEPVQGRSLYPMAEMITDLDPKFEAVYLHAGLTISDARWLTRVLEADCLYRKGIRNIPDENRNYLYLAFNLWYFLGRNRQASEILYRAAERMPAPDVVLGLAQRLSVGTGEIGLAERWIQQQLSVASNPVARSTLRRQLKRITMQKRLIIVDRAVQQFFAATGRYPEKIDELVQQHYLPGYPVDPTGGEIVLGADHHAYSTATPAVKPFSEQAVFADTPEIDRFHCREPGEPLTIHVAQAQKPAEAHAP